MTKEIKESFDILYDRINVTEHEKLNKIYEYCSKFDEDNDDENLTEEDIWKKIRSLKLHESYIVDDGLGLTKIIGGWLYTKYSECNENLSTIFVPTFH
jgi:hypothetical protein